jgi:hypothetical protein
MKKHFNSTGVCLPELHYMMDSSAKMRRVQAMVEGGAYFVISRPRQYGKTTMLHALLRALDADNRYVPVLLNFQGVDGSALDTDAAFAQMVAGQMERACQKSVPALAGILSDALRSPGFNMGTLSNAITDMVHALPDKQLVLLVDEVDASSNYAAFLNFLGMLRTKYLTRMLPEHHTFHSVVLAGVHDIKSLKYRLRNPDDAKFDSPWNIAADFLVDMTFSPQEIAPMLADYCAAEGVTMNVPAIAARLHYHTAGHPFLTSQLCKIIAEEMLPPLAWTTDDVDAAVRMLLRRDNTNFDSLIKNIANNKGLAGLLHEVLLEGEEFVFNPDEEVMRLGRTYGILNDNGRVKVQNRVYEQRIYNYLVAGARQRMVDEGIKTEGTTRFTRPDGTLDLRLLLTRFQAFMKEQRAERRMEFLEREWRLIFLAFLRPAINGRGHDFCEAVTSEERRMDVAVAYGTHRYVVELKIWRGPEYHAAGLSQLAGYLDAQGLHEGWLVIFDPRKKQSETGRQKDIVHEGKRVFAVWV